jgi:5'-nucleotidase
MTTGYRASSTSTASPIPTDAPLSRRARHGRSTIVKLALTAAPLVALVAVVGVGCAKEKPKVQASALDVKRPAAAAPAAGPAYGGPAYQPPPAPPAYDPPAQAVRAEPVAPAGGAGGRAAASASAAATAKPAAAAGNRTYVVQKGDTLFAIAKSEYGDGSKYKKIAAANPGVNAGALKAGQKIVIPQ